MSFDKFDTPMRTLCPRCGLFVDSEPAGNAVYVGDAHNGDYYHPGCVPVEEAPPTLVHSYVRETGELVGIHLHENGLLVMYVDGERIYSEAAIRWPHRYTVRTGKARAIEYERQDHEYTASLARTA